MDWAVSLLLLTLGQTLLVALGPLSRVADPGAGRAGPAGVALLAPDSVGYLAASSTWSGVLESPWPRWGYLIVLRVGHLLGDAATVAVLLQVLASVGAGVALLRAGRRLAGPTAGLVAAAVLLVNPMTAQWLRFVLTESLFYALAVAVVAAPVLIEAPDRRVRRLVILAAAAVVLRPTGPLLAGAALTIAAIDGGRADGDRRTLRRAAGIAAVWLTVVAALAFGSVATGPPAEGSLESQLRAGVVVEGTPEVRTTVAMPVDGAEGLLAYVLAHPIASARLAVTRVVVEVAQVRRHYPGIVNLALGAGMLVLLSSAAVGLGVARGAVLRRPTLVVLVPLVAIVAVTFAVPEGRYGWAGLVALAPAVGVGAATVLEWLPARRGRGQLSGGTAR